MQSFSLLQQLRYFVVMVCVAVIFCLEDVKWYVISIVFALFSKKNTCLEHFVFLYTSFLSYLYSYANTHVTRMQGQKEEDYFAHCMCTNVSERIARPLKPFVSKFWTYSDYPLSLGLSDFCSHDEHGVSATATASAANNSSSGSDRENERSSSCPNFPYVLVLSPVHKMSTPHENCGGGNDIVSPDDNGIDSSCKNDGLAPPARKKTGGGTSKKKGGGDNNSAKKSWMRSRLGRKKEETKFKKSFDSFIDDLQSTPVGTPLFDLFACPEPSSVPDPTKLQRIGRVITTSEIVTSDPYDGLFFRHQRKEEDFELRPEWRGAVEMECSPDGGSTKGTVAKLAGWELFEGHIAKEKYINFEKQEVSVSDGVNGSQS
mmetsp:Transcript_11290/g.15189  ORF Transcript_11290/g.15189 Transcript_11290/m.15189 type:complete len:373 (-) Transcript_11290:296-1414(-)